MGSGKLEAELKRQYIPMLQSLGMSSSEAQEAASSILEVAKAQSVKEGTDKFQRGFGDFLVEPGTSGGDVPPIVQKLRRNGVTDQDIRWWWNMHDLERRMMVVFDDMSRTSLLIDAMERRKLDEADAAALVRKTFPIFGDPDNTAHADGEDRPLPFELKGRVSAYMQKRTQGDPKAFREDVANFPTLNALVRHEMTKGNL